MTHCIKPLVWIQREPHFWAAEQIGGMNYITEYAGMKKAFKLDIEQVTGGICFDTIDEAKAAAQADYETRIRSAMIDAPPAVSDDMAALVGVLRMVGDDPYFGELDAETGFAVTAALAKMKGGVK